MKFTEIKLLPRKSGIYMIKNIKNDKIYIGSAKNLRQRMSDHRKCLRGKRHTNKYLQNSWNKYSEKNFTIETIEIVDNPANLIKREQYYLDKFVSYNKKVGYNICKIAGNTLGYKMPRHIVERLRKIRILTYKDGPLYNRKRTKEQGDKYSQTARKRYPHFKCCETGKIYDNLVDPSNDLNIPKYSIKNFIEGRVSTSMGYTFRFVNNGFNKKINLNRQIKNKPWSPFRCDQTGKVYTILMDVRCDLGISTGNLSQYLRGKRTRLGKYTFTYLNKKLNKIIKRVKSYTKCRRFICHQNNKIYNNISVASIDLKIKKHGIQYCLYKKNNRYDKYKRSCYGFTFDYVEPSKK